MPNEVAGAKKPLKHAVHNVVTDCSSIKRVVVRCRVSQLHIVVHTLCTTRHAILKNNIIGLCNNNVTQY